MNLARAVTASALWLLPAAAMAQQTPMTFASQWSSGTAYSRGAVVTQGSLTYVALAPSRNSAPSQSNPRWALIAAGSMDYQGSWSATATYRRGAVVRLGSQSFVSLQPDNRNRNPASQASFWAALGTNGNALHAGAGAPPASAGQDGDMWIDTATQRLYGPKTSSGWPGVGTALVGAQGARGVVGAHGAIGPRGAEGPQGPTGPQGAEGPQGPVGPTGVQGRPFGNNSWKQVMFSRTVAPDGEPVIMATLFFAPEARTSGLLSARGYCLVTSEGVAKRVLFGIGTDATDAFASDGDVGAVSFPIGLPDGDFKIDWTSERDVNVSGGNPYAYRLFAKNTGGATSINCWGSLTSQFHDVALP